MIKKKLTTTDMVLWMVTDNEEDLGGLDEDFSEVLMPEIWVIFSHHFLVEDSVVVVDHASERISERISRSDSGYPSRMRSDELLARSSSIVLRRVITVVASEGLPRPVRHVVDRGK